MLLLLYTLASLRGGSFPRGTVSVGGLILYILFMQRVFFLPDANVAIIMASCHPIRLMTCGREPVLSGRKQSHADNIVIGRFDYCVQSPRM